MEFGKKFKKNNTNKEFYSEPVYNEKHVKAKIKSYNQKINTISTIIKYQKKVLNLFVHQKF